MSTLRVYKDGDSVVVQGSNILIDEIFVHTEEDDNVIVKGFKQRDRIFSPIPKGNPNGDKPVNLMDEAKDRKLIQNWRRSGNTTRLVNLAVELLFEGKRVMMVDHVNEVETDDTEKVTATRLLVDTVRKRLWSEHAMRYQLDFFWDENRREMWISSKNINPNLKGMRDMGYL